MSPVVRPIRWLASLLAALAVSTASLQPAAADDATSSTPPAGQEASAGASKTKATKAKPAKDAKPKAKDAKAKDAKDAKAKPAKDAKPKAKDAKAKPAKDAKPKAKDAKPKPAKEAVAASRLPCVTPAVTIDRGGIESESIVLVDCKGKPLPEARVRLSVLARPFGVERPTAPLADLLAAAATGDGAELSPGVRLLDEGIVTRVFLIAHRFRGKPMSLVSGYRPSSKGSLHQGGKALDVRVSGVDDGELAAFCKGLPDTGCGYYPNNAFVHVDVRAPGEGTVYWIDAAGPGEAPVYVSSWPVIDGAAVASPVENEAPVMPRAASSDAARRVESARKGGPEDEPADVSKKGHEGTTTAAAKDAKPPSKSAKSPKKTARAKVRAEKGKPADKRRATTP